MASEFDLEIGAGDLVFGEDDEPRFLAGLVAIAQDVRHRLLVSGLLAELVADDGERRSVLARIAFEAEGDERLRPGSARAQVLEGGQVRVTARTIAGSEVSQTFDTQG